MGARRITVSTVGVVPGHPASWPRRPEQFRLAVSLHAPNHELRQKLIPLEKSTRCPSCWRRCAASTRPGGKRITFEYTMIDGVNDAPELADGWRGWRRSSTRS